MIVNRKPTLTTIPLILLVVATGMASTPPNMISTENMCGAVALTCAARAAGAGIDIGRLAEELPLNGEMKSFTDLDAAARKLGLATRVVYWRRDQSPRVPAPCIVRLVPGSTSAVPHFAILLGATPGAVHFFDPPNHAVWIADEELFGEWDGVALYVATDPKLLNAVAPASSLPILGICLGCVLMGAGMRWRVGRSWQSESTGRSQLQRARWGLLVVSCLGWFAVASGITLISFVGPRSSRQSLITVEPPAFDIPISEVELRKADGRVQGTFVLQNRGDRPAVIAHIVPNCTCARVTVSSSRIPAHGSAWIKTDVTLRPEEPSREAKIAVELKDAIPERLVLRVRARRLEGSPRS